MVPLSGRMLQYQIKLFLIYCRTRLQILKFGYSFQGKILILITINDTIIIMNIKPIKTAKDYQQALTRLEVLVDAKSGSSKGDELEVLGMLVDNYENNNFPIGFPDPVEAIKFRMEQLGYSHSDLANIVGLTSNASEILNRKKKLSLEMIRQIHVKLTIPLEVLIQAY